MRFIPLKTFSACTSDVGSTAAAAGSSLKYELRLIKPFTTVIPAETHSLFNHIRFNDQI